MDDSSNIFDGYPISYLKYTKRIEDESKKILQSSKLLKHKQPMKLSVTTYLSNKSWRPFIGMTRKNGKRP